MTSIRSPASTAASRAVSESFGGRLQSVFLSVLIVGTAVLLLPLVLLVPVDSETLGYAAYLPLDIVCAVFVLSLGVNWYISLAACSLIAIRCAIIVGAIITLLPAVGMILISGGRLEVLIWCIGGIGAGLVIFWLFVSGLWPLLGRHRAQERRIFATQVGESRLFRPVGMLIRDLCRFTGLVVLPGRPKLKKMAIAAALFAFLFEGIAYHGYREVSWSFLERADKLAELDSAGISNYLNTYRSRSLPGAYRAGAAFMLFAVARVLRRFALRRSRRTADAARFEDPRPPILFLRSFRDDQVTLAEAPLSYALRFFDPGTQAGTLEALLLRVMTPVGPLIAVGNPDEPIAPSGAARRYITDLPWEDVLRNLIREARLIVVGLDATPGVRWELNEIAAQAALEKTLVIVRPRLAGRGEVNLGILATVGIVPTGIATAGGKDIGFLFESDETLVTLTSNRVSELEYEVALRWLFRGW
jgi:hypothetical protein